MLCSISTGKSGSKWLDRLRSAKGFPTGNDDDLEHFLTHRDPNLSNSPITKPSDPKSISDSTCSDEKPVQDRSQPPETGEKEWFGIMSNVLAELFNMGDSNQIPKLSGKKSSRKQTNPKICLLSSVRQEDEVPATAPSSGDNSLTEMKDSNGEVKTVNQGKVDCLDAEEEKCNQDLSAYSRSEVTVIDTSCAVWKFEKLLFRKKNVWKVRDKKGKSRSIGRKKRKASECDEQLEARKKMKLSVESFKERNEEESAMPSNEILLAHGLVSLLFSLPSTCPSIMAGEFLVFLDPKLHPSKVSFSSVLFLMHNQIPIYLELEIGSAFLSRTYHALSCDLVGTAEEQSPHNAKKEECKETSDGLSQVPKKRQVILSPFSRLPRKSREGGSPVILVRGSKKTGANLPKITLKDTSRRHKA
ncbi:hypothetical protein CK203_029321 [Vitis vinifera]|uniref:Uncharacterized protein n=1 Tax=Vitis vinifera TaxID=29760 RepID=A0A438HX61_VITVI|nr:hypothetical protein CK203_029321 [Vitis vinifera]